jgi:competence protein ComEC
LVGRRSGRGFSLDPGDAFVILGGRIQSRLKTLFPKTAGLAAALIWARKEGLDPEIREAFARAGTAHLLAISGFHVGVVAGLLLLLLGSLGPPHAARFLLATVGVWLYVSAIGAPDAALRAALLFSALALGRLWNRSVSPLGALASAFLIFLLLDPGALTRSGFQLSFAGALGLVLSYRSVRDWLSSKSRGRLLPSVIMAVAAGVAATLATLPLVAWHFGRVSLIGIPVTLLAAPLVALAIPGIFGSLLLSVGHPGLGGILARGVELNLQLFTALIQGAATLPFASVWVSRPTVVAGTVGAAMAALALQLRPELRKTRRSLFIGWSVVVALLAGPLVTHSMTRGVLELVVLDVGQGDALLLRSPGGRWILVDAGPRSEPFDAGARTVLPYLRRRGVRALDLLVLTHPDMDHVGGAPALLRELPVRGIADPGDAAGKDVFLEVLQVAQEREVPWRILQAGDSLGVDGVALRIVGPEPEEGGRNGDDGNASSLVLEVRFGAFAALLTGDAPASSELRFLPRLLAPRIQILKVGHHGSSTSTTPELLERAEPEAALVSVGRRNRYGHPHLEVLQRLRVSGVRVLRTDTEGSLVVKARRDGSYQLSSSGGG